MPGISMDLSSATSQEGVQGKFRMGPAPVSFAGGKAIWLALRRRIFAPGLHRKVCARSLQLSAPPCRG